MADLFNPSPEPAPVPESNVDIDPSWKKVLHDEFALFPDIKEKLLEEKRKGNLVLGRREL